MNNIQPIPTTYNRINFRSRLEARWAVFFDLVSIGYEYEPEKTFTGYSRYIPDFFLTFETSGRVLFEVKGRDASMCEISKLANVCDGTAFISSGSLTNSKIERISVKDGVVSTEPAAFITCPFCGTDTIGPTAYFKFAPVGHLCRMMCLVAEHLDVSVSSFHNSTEKIAAIDIPKSPLISLALEFAQNSQFEDRNFYERLNAEQKLIERLKDFGVNSDGLTQMILPCLLLMGKKHGYRKPFDRNECPWYEPSGLSGFDVTVRAKEGAPF